MKVAVSGGGTGGHTLPVLAIINKLKDIDPDIKIFFIGSRSGLESQLIPKLGVRYYGISTGKFRRYHSSTILNLIDPTTLFLNIRDFFRFVAGIGESRKILEYEKPDVVFAKGGFVSLPVGYAARLSHLPLVIHESDTVMGMANRRMSRFASRVAVTFPVKMYPDIDSEHLVATGNPVRDDLVGLDRGAAHRELGLNSNNKTILIIGGSQGALVINEKIADIISELLIDFNVIWITGERDADLIEYRTAELPPEVKKRLKLFGFVTSEMAAIYAAADLVISRPGSNVLFELASLGKPAILIPPGADIAGGHQFENARYFSRNGGCLVIKQEELSAKKLLSHIKRLAEDEDELQYMSEKMKSLATPKAAADISELIYAEGEKHIEQIRKTKAE